MEIHFNFSHRSGVFRVKCIPSLGPEDLEETSW